MTRAHLNIHGSTWEQYDRLPEPQQTGNGGFRWKRLRFGDFAIAIHEPDGPRPVEEPAPDAGERGA